MFFFSYVKGGVDFVDRGSLDTVDYQTGDLTKDGNWHDLDVSSIVGTARRLVQVHCVCYATDAPKYVAFRTKGYTGLANRFIDYTQYDGRSIGLETFIYTDENGIIQYRFESATWTVINITIRGWFKL